MEEMNLSVDEHIEEFGCSLGEELIRPTKIYVEPVLRVLRNHKINGLVHNTGGGFLDNVPRILPAGCKAVIDPGSWRIPPIFDFLEKNGNVSKEEMFRTFNMGIGMMALVDDENVEDVLQQFEAFNEEPSVIGEIVSIEDEDSQWVSIQGIV